MNRSPLRERIAPLPPSPGADAALIRLSEAAERQNAAADLAACLEAPHVRRFLESALGDCPHLLDLAVKDVGRLQATLAQAPEDRLAAIVAEVAAARHAGRAEAMPALRRAKQAVALTLGLADLARAVDLDAVTDWLTRFADAALVAALFTALEEARAKGQWRGGGPQDCGLILLAMGKHGAFELNYSSDIDIIALYDPEADGLADGVEPSGFWVRIVRLLVTLLQERTADGYVFRVDLRLRPDPGATPVAISLPAAFAYYESMGQNWERAALIKARAGAGDVARGAAFLREIAPFIWRKYLDFAAIADIHSIKRQTHAHFGHAAVRVAGHDVKRGRGGIREVELFVQTQQLIAGGRDPSLRGRRTRDMLKVLSERTWISAGARDVLDEAYVFLRMLEHRLQMVRDEQTHTLPKDGQELARIGRLMGYASVAEFEAAVRVRLSAVVERTSDLFGEAPALSSGLGNLVFTGGDDDPETLQTLSRLGYLEPQAVTAMVRAWHFGRYPAMRSTAARERMTELTPSLLETFSRVGNPDQALLAFDALLKGLPAGVQLLAMLAANRQLLELLALILGAAPRLAEIFARRPHVVDALIDPGTGLDADRATFSAGIEAAMEGAADFEDSLNRARRFASEQRFRIATRFLMRRLQPLEAGFAFSDLADTVVGALFERVREAFAAQHGHLPGGVAAIVAFGRLGSREMTMTSDLDLLVVYDYAADATASDGARPLSPAQYYTRLTQRLVAALSAPTAEGAAYAVDLRLRPSGRAGPLATHFIAFSRYQAEEAWTWEHMALSRARTIAGDDALAGRVEAVIADLISRPRDRETLARDIRDMRRRVAEARGSQDLWALKTREGGLIDAEFVAQFAVLAGLARRPGEPVVEILARGRREGALPEREGTDLVRAAALQGALLQGLRVADDRPFDPAAAPEGLKAFLTALGRDAVRAAVPDPDEDSGPPSFADLEALLRDAQAAAARAFRTILGEEGEARDAGEPIEPRPA